MEIFRIPSHALFRQYLFGLAAFVFGGIVAWLKGMTLPMEIIVFFVLSIMLATFLFYWFAKRKIWVTILPQGIQGSGLTGNKSMIEWSAPVILKAIAPPRFRSIKGITLFKIDNDGALLPKESIFIPKAIFESQSFQSTVNRFAQSNHPILQKNIHKN
ncbi:hypothetical protein AAKU64_002808 [Undibacterium sp. GrIS 1.8]|uniref:NfeD family protein n=1 Tax=Undibacterium sp. GrIS 1.8 TaxID=3143934 RepID=UPI0033923CAC